MFLKSVRYQVRQSPRPVGDRPTPRHLMKTMPIPSARLTTRHPPKVGRKDILLADDHPLMRAGIKSLIHQQPDLRITAEASTPAEAFTHLSRQVPDLLLTDLQMPGRCGTEFIEDVLAVHPTLPILVLSMHDERLYAASVLNVGAQGYLMKGAAGEHLLQAIREVLNGDVFLSDTVKKDILRSLRTPGPRNSASPVKPLTNREFQIYQQIGMGKKPRDIADDFGLSVRTVDAHRCNMRNKLELEDLADLTLHAVRWVEANARGPRS